MLQLKLQNSRFCTPETKIETSLFLLVEVTSQGSFGAIHSTWFIDSLLEQNQY
jgi:hypothetical protein